MYYKATLDGKSDNRPTLISSHKRKSRSGQMQ